MEGYARYREWKKGKEGEREKKLANRGRPQDEFRRCVPPFFPLFSNLIGDEGVAGLQEGWLVGWLITRLVGGGEGKGFIVT